MVWSFGAEYVTFNLLGLTYPTIILWLTSFWLGYSAPKGLSRALRVFVFLGSLKNRQNHTLKGPLVLGSEGSGFWGSRGF